MAEIVLLHGEGTAALSDVPSRLRKIADQIEAGECGEPRNAVVILEAEGLRMSAWGLGPDGGDRARAVGLMEWAKHWFMARCFAVAAEEN
jgi:hypothetical protein